MNLNGARNTYLHWLEDECFFSLCSRQHFFWGNHTSEETLSYLFRGNTSTFCPDFPTGLNLLNTNAKTAWGSSGKIICEHTISPIFFPFQSHENIHALKQAMNSPSLGSLKYRLGLVTSRFGGDHPLKACNHCMTSDRSDHGVAYWHLSHQLPGVITCPVHGCLLLGSRENRQWSKGIQWLLPDELFLAESGQPAPSASILDALQAMSSSVLALAKVGTFCHFEPDTAAQVYKEAINCQRASRYAREAIADRFAQFCSILQPYPPFSGLPCTRQGAIGFMSQMTRKPRGYRHPLKHLTLISCLFGRFESFVEAYQRLAAQHPILGTGNTKMVNPVQHNEAPLQKIETRSRTLKPKMLFKELKEEILEALVGGTCKKEVCNKFGISISTVNRLLRLDPLAEQQINRKIYLNKQEQQRNKWILIVGQNPSASANDIKKLAPNVYAWLYRNDRSWLAKQNSSLPSGRRGNYVKIDWDNRDESLCILIKQALSEYPADLKKILKRELYQMVPSLFSALEKRTRYPKTRRLLSEIGK